MGYVKTLVDALQAFNREYSPEIQSAIYQRLMFPMYMTPKSGVTDEHIGTSVDTSEVLQGYQKAFTPKGDATLTPYKTKARPVKIDFKLEEVEKLRQTYLAKMYREANGKKQYDEMDFVKFLLTEQLPGRIAKDMEVVSWQGNYAAPTAGTAGTALEATDGIGTVISDEITAGNIAGDRLIVTGAVTSTNIVDKIELFLDALPDAVHTSDVMDGANVFISHANLRAYLRAYATKYGTQADYKGPVAKAYGSNVNLVGIPGMGSGDRFLFTPKANLIHCFDKVDYPTEYEFEVAQRTISVYADWIMGFGFESLGLVYVNDQA